jgi:hypothetical protein
MVDFGSGVVLAIDFGSSNTAAAFRDRQGRVQEVRLSASGTLMPSGVFFDGSRFLVGRTALQAAFTSPEAFEPSPKRRLADREIFLAGSMVPVTKMVAAVFAEVLARAGHVMGADPDVVMVTHPDQWSTPLQKLLAEGAIAGGVDPTRLRLVSEAQAAAWFYAVSAPQMAVGSRLVVFDFGAGTCDVAVLDKQSDQTFAVIASDGLDGLGGHDLDARIQAWVRRQLSVSDPVLLAEVNDPGAIATRLTLNDRIRDAKEALSEASSAAIVVAASADTQVLQLTRDEFDELIGPDIGRAADLTKRVMGEAEQRVPSTQSATIYLTGGSSSIPLVHSRLAELGPLGVLGDPKTVVVQGALYTPQASPAPQQVPTAPPVAPPTSAPTPTQHGGVVPLTAGNTGAIPVIAPPAQFTGAPPPYPPPNMASGPLPLQHPTGGTAANPMKKWAIVGAGVAAAVIALVVVLVATGVFSSGSSPATPAASASSSKASTTTASSAESSATASGTDTSADTPPPMTDNDYRLLKLLPSGYSPGACTPAKQRVTDALSTLECDENSEPGGPTSSLYSLFPDPATLAAHFQFSLNEDVVSNCPGDSEPGATWHYQDTPNITAGRVGCGTYKNNPDIIWTKDDQLLLGDGGGPDINALHQWWAKYG